MVHYVGLVEQKANVILQVTEAASEDANANTNVRFAHWASHQLQ